MNLLRIVMLQTTIFATKSNNMSTNDKISRRSFIKTSVMTGGVLLASSAMPGHAMERLQEQADDGKFRERQCVVFREIPAVGFQVEIPA